MKLFFVPERIRCTVCRAALWIEGEPTRDGRIVVRCIARGCSRKDVCLEVKLPHLDAKEVEDDA